MSVAESKPAAPKPKHRWFQFSLRTMFAGVAVLALLLGLPWFCGIIGFSDPVKHLAVVVRHPPDPEAMGDAIDKVHQSRRDEEAFNTLQPLLSDPDPMVRSEATIAIVSLDVESCRKIPLLIERLSDTAPPVRSKAAEGLGEVGASDPRVVPALRNALHDSDPWVRQTVMRAIQKIGPGASAAVPDLVAQLATAEDWVAAEALGSIGPEAKAAVPALMDLLQRSKGYARLEAARAIWKIDRNAEMVVPALISSLHDDYGPIRVEAAETLGKIGPPAAIALPVLKEMLDRRPQQKARSPQEPGGGNLPRVEPMTEAEFDPQIKRAVSVAIDQITGAKENR